MRHGKICEVLDVFVKATRGCRKWATVRWWGEKDDEYEEGPGLGNGYTPKTGGQPCCLRHQILFAAQEPPWNVTLGCDCGDG